jgi:hypothetical protein
MEMEVFVRVDMIQRQTSCSESFELRPNLGRQLATNLGKEKEAKTIAHHIAVEPTPSIHQVRDPPWRKHCLAIGKHQVQTDGKPRQTPRTGDGISCRRGCDHQTGRP